MYIILTSGNTDLLFHKAGGFGDGVTPSYPFLEDISTLVESSTAESGNANVLLSLDALRFLSLFLNALVVVYSVEGKALFEGIATDFSVIDSINIQLEA